MTRAEDRRARARRKMRAEQRALAEAAALESFIPTPRPTLVARAVQRVLGPPPVDDPVHGRRENIVATVREALDLDRPTQAPADPAGPATTGDSPR